MSTMTRRTFGLAAALLGLLSVASTTQATIYYSNPDGSVHAMNDDGTNQTVILGSGTWGNVSYRLYGGNLPRLVTYRQTGTVPNGRFTQGYGELFTVVPDGSGGATLTQITNFAANNWYIGSGNAKFANDDSSITVCVYDATALIDRFVRIHVPGGNTGGNPVTPTDTRVEVVYSFTPGYPSTTLATEIAGSGYDFAWNPEGTTLAIRYVYNGSGNVQLLLVTPGNPTPFILFDNATNASIGFTGLQWSPQPGSPIITFTSGNLYVMDTHTGVITKLLARDITYYNDFLYPCISPNGLYVAFCEIVYPKQAGKPPSYNVARASATTPTKNSNIVNLSTNMSTVTNVRTVLGWR